MKITRLLSAIGLILFIGQFAKAQQGMGVGTNNPLEMMQVEGAIKIGTDFNNSNAAPTGGAGTIRWNGTNFQGWDGTQWIDFTGSGTAGWELTGNAGTTSGTDFLGTTDNTDFRIRTNNIERLTIENGSDPLRTRVGIGTNTVSTQTIWQAGFEIAGNVPNLILNDQTGGAQDDFTILNGGGTANILNGTTSSNIMTFGLANYANNVGIGTTTPSDRLHVEGNIRMVDGNQQAGYVPVSDANGTMTWTTPSSISGINQLVDADNDTKVQVEESPDEDIIRFDVEGTESFTMQRAGNYPYLRSVGNSVYIGNNLSTSVTGPYNVAVGFQTGANLTSGQVNTFVGANAGGNMQGGSWNVMMGNVAGQFMTGGGGNVIIGGSAGRNKTGGGSNVLLGIGAGQDNATGGENVMVGPYAGENNEGNRNVFLGRVAGQNSTGSSNVFIGNGAGRDETASNRLYIDNSNTTAPLIYGEFDNDIVGVNGNLGVGTQAPAEKFAVWNGDAIIGGNQNVVDRGITLYGARNGTSNTAWNTFTKGHAFINFDNYDGGNSAVQYTGAVITSVNNPGSDDGDLRFLTASDQVLTEAMRITYDGNVGIGDHPAERFHVAGNIRMVDGNQQAGYVPVSDANGTMSWADPNTLVSDGDWTISGNDQYSAVSGNVGIGTTTPGSKLDVDGNIVASGSITAGTSVDAANYLYLDNTNGSGSNPPSFRLDGYLDRLYVIAESNTNGPATGTEIRLRTATANNSASDRVTINNVGNVGVGTTAPGEIFHVSRNSGNAIVKIESPGSSYEARMEVHKFGGLSAGVGYYPGNANLRLRTNTNNAIVFEPNGTEAMRVNNSGNVGIGVTNPGDELHVAGSIRMVDGNQQAGYVPVSDVNGTMSWADPNTLVSDGDWTINGNDQYSAVSGNVGIGTTTPDHKFQVVGLASFGADGQVVSGNRNVAFGQSNSATNNNSIVGGFQSHTEGNITFALGYQDTIGNVTGSGIIGGRRNTITANYGFIGGGENNEVSAIRGFVGGGANQVVSGNNSAIIGGINNEISGTNSFTSGSNNSISGGDNAAIGSNNVVSGNSGFAAGSNNTSGSFGEFVVGINATEYTPVSTGAYNANDRVFVVGNGPNTSSRSNALTIYKNGTVNINDAYDLPIADGTSGYVMTTDGSGVVSWTDPSTLADPDWTVSGNNIYNSNSGFVGVGTNAPNSKLTVGDPFSINMTPIVRINTSGNQPLLVGESTTPKAVMIGYDGNDIQGRTGAGLITNGNLILNQYGGNVGVGSATPISKLDVNGTGWFRSSAGGGLATSAGSGVRVFYDSPTDVAQIFAYDYTGGASKNLVLQQPGGNVGIGDNTPDAKLDVEGSIQMVDGNQAAGYIPVSDANGTMTWTDPTSIATASVNEIVDADNDTKVQVEENADEDIIRFDVSGTEMFTMQQAGNYPYLQSVSNSVFIGNNLSTTVTGAFNNAIGYSAGASLTTGQVNVMIGANAGAEMEDGSWNVMMGNVAGRYMTTGGSNTIVGGAAGANKTGGGLNVLLGFGAGSNNATGAQNVMIGYNAGENNTGNGSVFIGTGAGQNEASGNRLYIDNTNTGAPLIYGEFDNDILGVNGKLGVGTQSPQYTMTVNGNASDTEPILGLLSGNGSTSFNDGAQIAFGYNGTATYQHFIHTRHNASAANNAIDFYVSDGTQNNTLTSGSTHVMSMNAGNVGIGITTPSQKLHIEGSIRMVDGNQAVGFIPVSDANGTMTWTDPTTIATADDGDWTISGNDQYSAVSGNVGIGTTTPGSKLDVDGAVNASGGGTFGNHIVVDGNVYIENTNGTGSNNPEFRLDGSYDVFYMIAESGGTGPASGTQIRFRTAATNVSASDRMTIDKDGNVGIGTTTPSDKLHVVGNARVENGTLRLHSNDAYEKIHLTNAGTNGSKINHSSGWSVDYYAGPGTSITTGMHRFFTTNGTYAEQMRISSNGNVGIGTTSPTSKLDVDGKTTTDQVQVGANGSTFSTMQSGTATIGSHSGGVKVVTVNFPASFGSAPRVMCTVRTQNGQSYNDTFSVTTKQITTTSFQVNIHREDSDGGLWGQTLLLDWFAVQ